MAFYGWLSLTGTVAQFAPEYVTGHSTFYEESRKQMEGERGGGSIIFREHKPIAKPNRIKLPINQ